MDMLGLLLIAVFAFFALIVFLLVVYLMWKRFSTLVKFEKTLKEGRSNVFLQAFIPLRKITIEDNIAGGPIVFVREDLKAGEKLYFTYPPSSSPAKLMAEGEESFSLEAQPKPERA